MIEFFCYLCSIPMNRFDIYGRIGEGAHGYVVKGLDKKTNREVALKKLIIKNLDEGIPKHIMREMLALRVLKSKYIVELYTIIPHGMGIVLAMEYLPSSLYDLLKDETISLDASQIKSFVQMLFLGLEYMHGKGLMHRDIKPANLLIASDGTLKIADLGLARIYSEREKQYSHQVATRWYRAPELLYGSRCYTPVIDIWASGCILAEMIRKSPLFAGETDIEQLAIVIHTLGTPNEATWPGITTLPDFNKISFRFSPGVSWEEIIPNASPDALDLIKNCVQYNPALRPSAKEALEHDYFSQNPLPCPLKDMPKPEHIRSDYQSSEWENFDDDFSDLYIDHERVMI